MRRRFALMTLVLALNVSGCAWAQRFQEDPIAALQEGVGYVRTALSLATSAFEMWATANPETSADARTQFHMISSNVDRGLIVAQDGLRLAASASGPAPDINVLLRDAQTAMGSLHQFLVGLPSGTAPRAGAGGPMQSAIEATERASRPVAHR